MRKNLPIPARLSGVVSFVLTVLLAVQVATAFLPPAGSAQADARELVICSADGVQTISLPQSEGDSPHDDMAGHCPLCIVSIADVSPVGRVTTMVAGDVARQAGWSDAAGGIWVNSDPVGKNVVLWGFFVA